MKEILAGTFGSIDKMLSGKKYPQNFRALRMLVEEVLRSAVLIQGVTSFVRLVELPAARAGRSRTMMMWTDNLVKTVIIMMNFSRGALVEDMKGTGFFISWLRKTCHRTSVPLVVTTTHAILRSTFITRKDLIR